MHPTDRTPHQQLSLFFLIWAGCFLLFSLLSQGFLIVYLGKASYEDFLSGTSLTQQHIQVTRMLQILLSIGIFGVPPVAFILLDKTRDWSFFKADKLPHFNLLALTILLAALSLPLVAWALEMNQKFEFPSALHELESYLRGLEGQNKEFLQALLQMNNNFDFCLNFLMIAIVPPIVEELLFRGTLQQLLQKQVGSHIAILLAGAFFSFIHMEFYGFLPRMLLGIMFGYLFLWSGSLWVPILAHFLHNGLQVVLLYLFQSNLIQTDIEQMDSFPPYVTMGATVFLFLTLSIFDHIARKQNPRNGERLGESVHNK